MRTLSQSELLAAWETALDLAPPARAVALLRASGSDRDPAHFTPGERDGSLLEMRERLFGSDILATAACPRCGEAQEFELRVEEIRSISTLEPSNARELSLSHDGCSVVFRVPDATDLMLARAETQDLVTMRTALLERCVLYAESAGVELRPAQLPESVVAAISRRLAEVDPQGEIELSIECSSCQFAWLELFDIVSFLWGEIQIWAMRTLNEVHQLAAAYGWGENEVLSVSPRRRAFYLDLIAS